MVCAWTLPLIRMELEMLPRNCDFLVDADDTARLFGADDAAAAHIALFAADHGCSAKSDKGRVTFRKLADRPAFATDSEPRPVECFPPGCPTPHPSSDDHPGPDCH